MYGRVPTIWRPALRRAFFWSALRLDALTSRRRVERAQRIEFLDFEIAHLEAVEFLGPMPTDVLVRSHASCVSPGTERAVLCGLPGARREFPYAPGYSTAGEVMQAAERTGLKVGERVAGRMSHSSSGVMTPASLFRVPDRVSDIEASFLEIGIICSQGVRKAAIRPGESVAVIGLGLIGQVAARLSRVAGAEPITGVAASRRRMKTAMLDGAMDAFIAVNEAQGAVDRVEADVVIEAVGSAAAIDLAMRAARRGGRVVLLGSSRDLGRNVDWWGLAQERDLTVVGAHISVLPQRDETPGFWTYEHEGRLFLDLLARGRLRVADLVTWHARPDECNRVYEVIAAGGADHVGIVFDWAEAHQVH
jgi:2-desacetyl-2-hydroxyethyl bacteriochlorophyllide A dehydrogenase